MKSRLPFSNTVVYDHPTGMEERGEAGRGLRERESSVLESEADYDILTTPDQQRSPAVMEV